MEDLIARIRAAIDVDESWARAACQPYPYATDKTLPPDGVGWEWVTGEEWEPVTPAPMVAEFVAPAGHNCWLATKETWPDSRGRQRRRTYTHDVVEMNAAAGGHIIRHGPKRVLRQAAAHRKILELHQCVAKEELRGHLGVPGAGGLVTAYYCPGCVGRDWDLWDMGEPCPIVLALAEVYAIDSP